RLLLGVRAQDLGEDELVAGGDEGLRRLLLAEAVHLGARFAQPRGERREIAVGGYEAIAVHVAGVQQVHRIDDQRRIAGILAARVAELLDRLDREAVQVLLPGAESRGGPVAVGALDARSAVA